tara:strand:- start:145 stop:375 length:231 start_codon:yes stop_codon:yes gene_type:complete
MLNILKVSAEKARLVLERVKSTDSPEQLKQHVITLTLQTYINDDHEERGFINHQFAKDLVTNEYNRKVLNDRHKKI